MEFLLALQFLTRIPINVQGEINEKRLARSMAYFPLVGLIIGLSTAILYFIVTTITNDRVADMIAVAFMILFTGNMHLDGLMDTADGIYSCRPREGILEIMKDSRVGAHGVAAGVLDILAKYVLLSQIPSGMIKYIALLIVPAISRWSQVYGAAKYPYARTSGGKSNFVDFVGKREVFFSSLTVVIFTYLLLGYLNGIQEGVIQASILLITSIVGIIFIGSYFTKKIDGITGDIIGAATECVEILALFTLVAIYANH